MFNAGCCQWLLTTLSGLNSIWKEVTIQFENWISTVHEYILELERYFKESLSEFLLEISLDDLGFVLNLAVRY